MTQKQKLNFFFLLEKSHFSFIWPKLDFCFSYRRRRVVVASSSRHRCVVIASTSHRRRFVVTSSSRRRRVVGASSALRPRFVLASSSLRRRVVVVSSLYRCCIVSSPTLLVLITQSFLLVETCAIPLQKALTKGFISSMIPKTSDQVMGTL